MSDTYYYRMIPKDGIIFQSKEKFSVNPFHNIEIQCDRNQFEIFRHQANTQPVMLIKVNGISDMECLSASLITAIKLAKGEPLAEPLARNVEV